MRLATVFLCSLAALHAQPFSTKLYDQMEWRLIGPFRGGRVIAVAGVAGDATTFYFGSVGGGVWKTTDGGTVWTPVFDQQAIASIGAVAVAPSDPNIIYAGSGEADMRSQIGFGDGIFKSVDAGRTWLNVGLRDSRQIACIRIDPRNPDLVYVAALGHAYGPNEERGVFRSIDGGRNWKRVLDKGPETGAVDLAFDPGNSQVIYATMWNARRSVWSQYPPLEGPGSGLYKTTDGGDHWSQIAGHGLPESQWKRSGVAVAGGGQRVYALIDAPGAAGLYRSDDAGANWTRTSADSRITSRSWYFSGITVDPGNADLVYVPNVALYRSTDGGRNFTVLKGQPGGDDYHILWIDPAEPRRMVLGSDQGTNISVDRGATWTTWNNQPTAQMYHVITDNRFPYVVYGSQQDSGTAAVASRTDHGRIDARDWFSVGGAEAGYIAIDQKDDNILYVGDTSGALVRTDRRNAQAQNITPAPESSGFTDTGNISTRKYRYSWTSPVVTTPAEPDALYYGSQYLMKTTDGGLTWREISPDLTGDTRQERSLVPGEAKPENARERGYGVVYSIAPSPLRAGLIWVGSDTGLIHMTRDGGKSWQNVTPSGLPSWSKIAQIEASHTDPAAAYAAVDKHRIEDYKPYIYRTRDYGKTWTPIASGLEAPAYVNGIREDPVRKGLLYAATELGVAVSFDDGDHWQPLQLNLPTVSVRDLVIHGDDLVAATHGRGFWILDDISPLRQIDAKAAAASAFLYKPAPAIRLNPEAFSGTPFPPEEPQAKNPPDGAIVDYYLKAGGGEVMLEILDGKGQVVRKYASGDPLPAPDRAGAIADYWIKPPVHLTARPGMNRFTWDLRYPEPAADESAQTSDGDGTDPVMGPQVPPGRYQVRLTAEGQTLTQPLEVVRDPRSKTTAEDFVKQFDLSYTAWRGMTQVAAIATQARALRSQLAERLQAADKAGKAPLVQRITSLDADAASLLKGGGGRGQFAGALAVAETADRTPPAAAYQMVERGNRELAAETAAWWSYAARLPELNRELQQNNLPPVEVPVRR